jgi:hypothetical protein
MKLRRIVLWAVAAGSVVGAATGQVATSLADPVTNDPSPRATADVASLPDRVPALNSSGEVVACIKNPEKYGNDPEALRWPPGLGTNGAVAVYHVEQPDGTIQVVEEPISVAAAVANTNAQIRAQKGQPKNC